MAQAARLNLRMQKELKLLLTDPPPGASFPFLNADSDFCSLATIHAQIKGPEGSVYGKGTFSIKIQIPERYPFQPPNVTFATPIYHPNIDNGGRICLDILNLPPKGAWQPSLNISTVLTSIGLLLSEPNPDDGLMCEASREYKYNRQVFDQKARAMTEKFAKPGANLGSCSTQYCQSDTNSSTMMEVQGSEKESTNENNDFVSNHKKPCGIGRKLSLESSTSTCNRGCDGDANDILNHHLLFDFGSHIETKGESKEFRVMLDEYNVKYEKRSGTGRKLALESSVQFLGRDGRTTDNINPKQSQSFHSPQTVPVTSLDLPVLHIGNCNEQQLHQHEISKIGNRRTRSDKHCQVSHKKFSGALDASRPNDGINEEMHVTANLLPSRSHPNSSLETLQMASSFKHNELPCKDSVIGTDNSTINARCNKAKPVGTKLSLGFKASSRGQEKDDKENIVPIQEFLFSNPQTAKMIGISQKISPGPLIQLQGSNDDNSWFPDSLQKQQSNQHQCRNIDKGIESQRGESPVAESVIVLDSEDSEEEINGPVRSKLSLVRKCMKKRKSCA